VEGRKQFIIIAEIAEKIDFISIIFVCWSGILLLLTSFEIAIL
jgi:hypothetical protein